MSIDLLPRVHTLRVGPLKQLHIDKRVMAARGPHPVVVRCQGQKVWGYHMEIRGPSTFVYMPEVPLMPEGTYAWIETFAEVRVWY